ncbi:tetratricopeptide repeat protein [Scytonema sp. NUACC21]
MSQTLLPPEWLKQLSDPYAVLGISVTASEHQILKRYHSLAKQLHPDRFIRSNGAGKELARAVFTCLINPAYELLKQTNSRQQTVARLRLEARVPRLLKDSSLQTPLAQELIEVSGSVADIFYEQAIASLGEGQYRLLTESYQITQQLSELNLVYCSLPSADAPVQQNATDFVKIPDVKSVELTIYETKPVMVSYAQRHYQRGVEYVKQANWKLAVQELRDAIQLEPNNSNYLALLGFVYLKQNLLGMAKVYLRQALRLNPKQPLALKYASSLKLELTTAANPKSMAKALSIAALLGWLSAKKRSGIELG